MSNHLPSPLITTVDSIKRYIERKPIDIDLPNLHLFIVSDHEQAIHLRLNFLYHLDELKSIHH